MILICNRTLDSTAIRIVYLCKHLQTGNYLFFICNFRFYNRLLCQAIYPDTYMYAHADFSHIKLDLN